MNLARLTGAAVLAAALSACSSSSQSLPVTGAVANTTANATAGSMDAWHRALLQKKLPHAGCFRATYPSAQWAQIPCGTPPHLLYPPQPLRNMKKGLGQNVGDGRDFTADTSPK